MLHPFAFWPYDIESYPNVFTAVFKRFMGNDEYVFEVSSRTNQSRQFIAFLRWLGSYQNTRAVGFNNLGYDWPVCQHLMGFPDGFTADDAYKKSMQIIESDWNDRFKHVIWDRDQIVRQVDLMRMHGYDNQARSMSLKMNEVALRMRTVQDLPFPPGTFLRNDQIPMLLGYNRHDVIATEKKLEVSSDLIEMRVEIGNELGVDLMNKSDIDLGERIFIEALETNSPGITGTKGRGPKRTTQRSSIDLSKLVLPVIHFDHEEFRRIHQHFLTTKPITQTKGVFEGLVANCYGLPFKFGTGGIHAATENKTYRATPNRRVITVDVKSYYPNLSIHWGFHPEHLGQGFVQEYSKLYQRRLTYEKGTNFNTAIKLGLNAVFGKAGSKYSCMHDNNFLLSITINGQLLLCMLAEKLAQIPTAELFNVNTDGVTMAVDTEYSGMVQGVMDWWCGVSRLELELDEWEAIFQRDVNNYLGIAAETRKPKGKGAYEYRHGLEAGKYEFNGTDYVLTDPSKPGANWHKNQSTKIVTMAVEKFLLDGVAPELTISQCQDPYLFMSTIKVQRSDRLVLGGHLETYKCWHAFNEAMERETKKPGNGEWNPGTPLWDKHHDKAGQPVPVERTIHRGGVEQQRTGRYYVAKRGGYLFKIMPPLARLPNHYRPQAVESGRLIAMCNDVYYFDWANLSYEFYIEKAYEMIQATGFYNA